MPRLNEHEQKLCTVTQNIVVRDIQEKHKEETRDLRKKITEVEEALNLEKRFHSIDIEDKNKVIDEKQKRISDLEIKIDQFKRKSTELWKIFEENAMQSPNVVRSSVSEATGKFIILCLQRHPAM